MANSLVTDTRGTRIAVGLVPALYDRVDVTYPSATVEAYAFSYNGNPCGTVVCTYDVGGNLVSAVRTA